MKYSMEEALNRIEKRSKALRSRRLRRNAFGWINASLLLMILLIGAVARRGRVPMPCQAFARYGASIMPAAAGGYVLVGVICFAAAVGLTIACIHYRNRHGR
ncbi:MAG: hypothetical protein IJJ23_06920 [Clostridia bacterium]|nr:hypothetical protein [Clostridia bacterium]